jgi:hypothetical protein
MKKPFNYLKNLFGLTLSAILSLAFAYKAKAQMVLYGPAPVPLYGVRSPVEILGNLLSFVDGALLILIIPFSIIAIIYKRRGIHKRWLSIILWILIILFILAVIAYFVLPLFFQ